MQFEKVILIGLIVAFLVIKSIELYFLVNNHSLNNIDKQFSAVVREMQRYNNNIANAAHGRPVT